MIYFFYYNIKKFSPLYQNTISVTPISPKNEFAFKMKMPHNVLCCAAFINSKLKIQN